MRILFAAALAACLTSCAPQSASVLCADGRICPENTACDLAHAQCVDQEQLDQCAAVADRERCTLRDGSPGTCDQEVCLAAECGNGRLDHPEDEICDDGNNADDDGCSGNCLSDETCGNFVVDSYEGEGCDDGNLLDSDGCSSLCQHETAVWVRAGDPGELSQMRAVYDAARHTVVMFGGRVPGVPATPGIPSNATYEWNGTWRRIDVALAPLGHDVVPSRPVSPIQGAHGAFYNMAYDIENRRTVFYGGRINGVTSREVWAWDGAVWTQLPDAPYGLEGHAMAYDAKRKRIVVAGGQFEFGGDISAQFGPGTLEFDGQTWTLVDTPTKPGPRLFASMTYDPKRGVMVMYGGTNTSNDQLWEYDGTDWTLRASAVTGSRQVSPMLAYDSISQRVVIFGASVESNLVENRTFLWDGTTLTQHTSTVPVSNLGTGDTSSRRAFVLVEDGHGRLMLYGGERADNSYQFTQRLTWFWTGDAWEEGLQPTPGRFFASVPVHEDGKIIRFGGDVVGGALDPYTWEHTRKGWTRYQTGNPTPLQVPAMAYDDERKQVVLFGGNNGSAAVDELWARSNTTWTQVTKSGAWPAARLFHSMTFDGARDQVVLFGGQDATAALLGDTWTWNGTAWTPQTAPGPSPRGRPALGYDPIGQIVVLFGGSLGSGGVSGETWVWDGTTWTNLTGTFANTPLPRWGGALVYNPARRALTLVGEFSQSDSDTWEWRTTQTSPPAGTWTRVETVDRPPTRAFGGAFSTLDGSGITVQHGLGGSSGYVGDQWQLRFSSPRASDACEMQVDTDGDARIGCDPDSGDPDCWPVCSPACPPGLSCPATARRCGDGMCDALESCQSCPADCTAPCSTARCGNFACDGTETTATCPGDCPP